jgi:acylphosphatase
MSERLREIWYSGHVQGVGFRYTACSIARGYSVTGFVQNLPDGRVHLLAEGPTDQIDGFLAEIAERMGQYIRKTASDQRPATGQYREFEVRA